jgi:hypothetical protein
MLLRLLSSTVKIAIASLIVGVFLSYADISPQQVLIELGMTPDEIISYLARGVNWAIPNLILGAIVTVPVWLIIYLFRPPKG